MAEENIIPPMEAQEPEPTPMMKFSDLETMVDQAKASEDKGEKLDNGQGQPPVEGQAPEDPVVKALAETGFKSVDELVKSQKEGHATITKLSQERAALQRDLEAMAQFPQMLQQQMRTQPTQAQQLTQPQVQPDSLTVELFKDMAPFVAEMVRKQAMEIADHVVDQKLSMRELSSKVAAKRAENPEEFDDLRPIMQHVLQQNPHYEAHPDGLNAVYEKAKMMRDARLAKMTETLFGTDLPLDKVREAIKVVMAGQQPQAQPQQVGQTMADPSSYVPPAGANTPPMNQKATNYDSEIASRMKGKINSQTVDEVTDLWWNKVMQNSQAQSQTNRPRR